MAGHQYKDLHQAENSVSRAIWSLVAIRGHFLVSGSDISSDDCPLPAQVSLEWVGALMKGVVNEPMNVSHDHYGQRHSDKVSTFKLFMANLLLPLICIDVPTQEILI